MNGTIDFTPYEALVRSKYINKFYYFGNLQRRILSRYIETGDLDLAELRRFKKDIEYTIDELEKYTNQKDLDRILGVMHVLWLSIDALKDAYHFNKEITDEKDQDNEDDAGVYTSWGGLYKQ